jgi:hypothetical protein
MPGKRKIRSSKRQKGEEAVGRTVPLLPVNIGNKNNKQKRGEGISKVRSLPKLQRVMEEETSDGENLLRSTTDKHLAMRRKFNKGGNNCDGNNSGKDESDKDEDTDSAGSKGEGDHHESERTRLPRTGSDKEDEDINRSCSEEPLVSNDDSAAVDEAAEVSLCLSGEQVCSWVSSDFERWTGFLFADTTDFIIYTTTGCRADYSNFIKIGPSWCKFDIKNRGGRSQGWLWW